VTSETTMVRVAGHAVPPTSTRTAGGRPRCSRTLLAPWICCPQDENNADAEDDFRSVGLRSETKASHSRRNLRKLLVRVPAPWKSTASSGYEPLRVIPHMNLKKLMLQETLKTTVQ